MEERSTAGAGNSSTPLRKLGVTGDNRVLVQGAPEDLELGAPHHTRAGRTAYDVQLIFCPDAAALRRRWPGAAARSTERGAVWVAWPKRASGLRTDLTEDRVREHALPLGWVDVKVCAVDATWSGLKLVRRLGSPTRPT